MNTRRFFTILLFFLFTHSLFSEEGISELLEHWSAGESALYNWQNADEISSENSTAPKLFDSLEQFNEKLKNFTVFLIFLQYEGIGLLPKDSGKNNTPYGKRINRLC